MNDLTKKKLDNIAKDLGSKATLTPVPNIPLYDTPTHPLRTKAITKYSNILFFIF